MKMAVTAVNTNLEYIYSSEHYNYLHNFPVGFDIRGKKVSEFPHPISEHYEEIEKQGIISMTDKKIISGITIEKYLGELTAVHSKTTPLIEDNKVIGCETVLTEVNLFSIRNMLFSHSPTHLVFQRPDKIFTELEYEVLFLLSGAFSRKEIAKILDVSLTTVAYRISCCFDKTGCSSMAQLIEYCHNHNITRYVPEIFRKVGHRILV